MKNGSENEMQEQALPVVCEMCERGGAWPEYDVYWYGVWWAACRSCYEDFLNEGEDEE